MEFDLDQWSLTHAKYDFERFGRSCSAASNKVVLFIELGSASVLKCDNLGQYAMRRDQKEPTVRFAISAGCNAGHWECG